MALNQTDPIWMRGTFPTTLGTGVFLVSSGQAMSVSLVENVTYEAGVEQSAGALAFKWVPATIATFHQVVSSKCSTAGQDCIDWCPGLGCFCLNGKCAP